MQPNLELKTRPKQLLGWLPLDIALPGLILESKAGAYPRGTVSHSKAY